MKLPLAVSAIAMLAFVLPAQPGRAAVPADAGDPVINVNNNTIVKLNAGDGSVEWSTPANNDGSLSVDPNDFSISTSARTANTKNKQATVYKITPDGTVSWTNIRSERNIAAATPGAFLNFDSACDSYSDANPADAMVYRGGGDAASANCGPRVYQASKFSPAGINWSVDLSAYVQSVDALAVQPWQGGYVYAASAASSKIVVIDPATQTVVGSFETAIAPRHIAVNPNGGDLYLADGEHPFVASYSPTGALNWVNLNLPGAVSNIATAKGLVGVSASTAASSASCGAPTVRIVSDRNSLRKGESATISFNYGSSSLPPCSQFTIQYSIKTHAVNNVDYTFIDALGQDATVIGGSYQAPFTLTNLPTSRKKTLPLNITMLKDRAYYMGNKSVQVQLLARY